jgi:hypothetical protein
MNRFYLRLLFTIGIATVSGCSFFAEPDAENFAEMQINLRFAEAESTLSKPAAPQVIDRIVVAILERSDEILDNQFFERQVLRREFRLGNDGRLQAVIQVPLRQGQVNCFMARVQAFEGIVMLYSGRDSTCFDKQRKRAEANILMEPVAFNLQPFFVPSPTPRIFTLTGEVQDSAITRLEIVMADSVAVTLPVKAPTAFSNPIMLFGENALVKVSALRGAAFHSAASRRWSYTGRRAEVLVALVWNEPVDLDLQVINPLQQTISAIAPGDSVGGILRVGDDNGYGPEVYEWRKTTILQGGAFIIRVARPRVNLPPASGKVFVFFYEGLAQQSVRSFRFEFTPQDTQLSQTIFNFNWPVQ